MNKQELIDELSDTTGFTKADTQKFVNAYVEAITAQLRKGKDIQIVGFGTFKVSSRKERQGRNPQTGAMLKIPAKTVPTFKAGKALKDAVN